MVHFTGSPECTGGAHEMLQMHYHRLIGVENFTREINNKICEWVPGYKSIWYVQSLKHSTFLTWTVNEWWTHTEWMASEPFVNTECKLVNGWLTISELRMERNCERKVNSEAETSGLMASGLPIPLYKVLRW